MTPSTAARVQALRSMVSHEDRLLIIICADPDAMASAMALKRLLWRCVANVTIARINQVGRPDNRAMMRLLRINAVPIEKIDRTKFSRFAIVDSQPCHHPLFQDPNKEIEFDIIIDHHPLVTTRARFMDIRPDYGATSTILTQYLQAAQIKPSNQLATALFLGIKTDTKNFERHAIEEDIAAFQFLFPNVNAHAVWRIEQAEITLDSLRFFCVAFNEMRIRKKNHIFVHLGAVPTADICVSIAEFFMKVHDIVWVFVSGFCKGCLIVIARNDGCRKDAGKILFKVFGGFGSAGGHRVMARAEMPLINLEEVVDHRDQEALSKWLILKLENNL